MDGTVVAWTDSPTLHAGPTTFLPRPGAAIEDELDGVLLVDCLGADGRAFFVVLRGDTLVEVARVSLPYRHCRSLGTTWIFEAQ